MNKLQKEEKRKGNPPVVFNDRSILESPRGPGAAEASGGSPVVSESDAREDMSAGGTRSESPSSHSAPLLRGFTASEKAAEHDSESTESSSSGDSPASQPGAMNAGAKARLASGSWKPSVPSSTGQVQAKVGTRDRAKDELQDGTQTNDSSAVRPRGASQSGRRGSSTTQASWLAEDAAGPSTSSATPAKAEKKGARRSMPALSARTSLRAQLAPGDASFDETFNALLLPDPVVKACARFADKMSPLIPRKDGLNTHRATLEPLARKQVRKLNDLELAVAVASLLSVYARRCKATLPIEKLALDVALLVCGQAAAEMAARPASSEFLSDVHDNLVDTVTDAPGYKERFRGHHALMEYGWSVAREKEQEKKDARQLDRQREKKQARQAASAAVQRPNAGEKTEKKQEKKAQKERQKDLPKKPPKDRRKD